eukprot:CAMPEP_0182443748 /NCGR_PEP_ID=MMETSP1172-20130603/2396_1 /TAXON_ID=708627 /ORGANISM="Timspurckia oligopyrenoides, Strain CCMP3278" /LENGTH=202 /DNA_ID=CAMNT_0024639113 /DNA_START=502 /DNA_END=1107 /DNA_ORIENTATION=+
MQFFVHNVIIPNCALESNEFLVNNQTELNHFIDASVYSKNRCWRMLGSSKFGKDSVLKLRIQEHKNGETVVCNREIFTENEFLDTLVCYISDHVLDTPLLSYSGQSKSVTVDGRLVKRAKLERAAGGEEFEYEYGWKSSPFIEVDEFIKKLINLNRIVDEDRYSIPPRIDRWKYISSENRIVYSIGGSYRYCGNIQRHHKSN